VEGRKVKRMGWVLGWAVPQTWFTPLVHATFPAAAHTFVAAAPDALARLEATGPFDWVAGYSLGAQLLLRDAARSAKWGRVALLAPSFAFPSEAGMGGRIARAGLDVTLAQRAEVARDFLEWGLAQLETTALPPMLPSGWRAWCGSDDPLLDAAKLNCLVPGISVVAEATHHPAGLLRAFAEEVS
jgi:hypothetical protein